MSKSDDYENELMQLQLALIALQKKAIKDGDKILVIFEGRDSACPSRRSASVASGTSSVMSTTCRPAARR